MKVLSCLLVLLFSSFSAAAVEESPSAKGKDGLGCRYVLGGFLPALDGYGGSNAQEYRVSVEGLSPEEQIAGIYLLWHREFLQNQSYDLLLTSPARTKIYTERSLNCRFLLLCHKFCAKYIAERRRSQKHIYRSQKIKNNSTKRKLFQSCLKFFSLSLG